MNSINEYLGIALVAFLVILFMMRSVRFQTSVLEGMATAAGSSSSSSADKEKIAGSVKYNTTVVEDTLLINKYRKAYEDTIIELETNANMYILAGLLNNAETIANDPGSIANQKLMTSLNNVKAFKDTLNGAMLFLDKYVGQN